MSTIKNMMDESIIDIKKEMIPLVSRYLKYYAITDSNKLAQGTQVSKFKLWWVKIFYPNEYSSLVNYFDGIFKLINRLTDVTKIWQIAEIDVLLKHLHATLYSNSKRTKVIEWLYGKQHDEVLYAFVTVSGYIAKGLTKFNYASISQYQLPDGELFHDKCVNVSNAVCIKVKQGWRQVIIPDFIRLMYFNFSRELENNQEYGYTAVYHTLAYNISNTIYRGLNDDMITLKKLLSDDWLEDHIINTCYLSYMSNLIRYFLYICIEDYQSYRDKLIEYNIRCSVEDYPL